MSRISWSDIKRESRGRIGDTCPAVDKIMEEAAARIKGEVTEEFRQVLDEAVEELLEAQERITELEGQVEELEEKIEAYELQYELNH